MSGDCIRCPFHDWKFDGDTGTCVEVIMINDHDDDDDNHDDKTNDN